MISVVLSILSRPKVWAAHPPQKEKSKNKRMWSRLPPPPRKPKNTREIEPLFFCFCDTSREFSEWIRWLSNEIELKLTVSSSAITTWILKLSCGAQARYRKPKLQGRWSHIGHSAPIVMKITKSEGNWSYKKYWMDLIELDLSVGVVFIGPGTCEVGTVSGEDAFWSVRLTVESTAFKNDENIFIYFPFLCSYEFSISVFNVSLTKLKDHASNSFFFVLLQWDFNYRN